MKRVISRCNEQGDAALILIQSHCATVTEVDKNHYSKLLSQVTMIQGETITKYLGRFLYARHNSEHVGNSHDNNYLIDSFLAGMATCKDPFYMTECAMFMTRRQQGEVITFTELETKFLSLDETLARHDRSKRNMSAHSISINPNPYMRDKRKSKINKKRNSCP